MNRDHRPLNRWRSANTYQCLLGVGRFFERHLNLRPAHLLIYIKNTRLQTQVLLIVPGFKHHLHRDIQRLPQHSRAGIGAQRDGQGPRRAHTQASSEKTALFEQM